MKLSSFCLIYSAYAIQENDNIENPIALFILWHTDLFLASFCLFIILGLFLIVFMKKLSYRLRDINIIVKKPKESKSLLFHEYINKENIN